MNQKTKGILFIVCSAFCFALMNAFVRLAGDLPSIQKSFFRNAVALVFALVILLRERGGFRWKKGCLPLLLVRAGFGTVGILCNYYAIDRLLLSDASMLNKLSPFAAILFSLWFLHEKVKPVQAAAICVAFVGALCIIKLQPDRVLSGLGRPVRRRRGRRSLYGGARAQQARGARPIYRLFLFRLFLPGRFALAAVQCRAHDGRAARRTAGRGPGRCRRPVLDHCGLFQRPSKRDLGL